jgi:hypothetical protein
MHEPNAFRTVSEEDDPCKDAAEALGELSLDEHQEVNQFHDSPHRAYTTADSISWQSQWLTLTW